MPLTSMSIATPSSTRRSSAVARPVWPCWAASASSITSPRPPPPDWLTTTPPSSATTSAAATAARRSSGPRRRLPAAARSTAAKVRSRSPGGTSIGGAARSISSGRPRSSSTSARQASQPARCCSNAAVSPGSRAPSTQPARSGCGCGATWSGIDATLLEGELQRAKRIVGPRLDGAQRQAEQLGDLGLLAILAVEQLQDLPVGRGQRLHGVAHRQPLEDPVDGVLGPGRLRLGRLRLERPRRRPPPQVDGDPAGDREQEGRDRAPGRVEAARLLPEAHEGLLHQLLGQALVAEQPQGPVPGDATIHVVVAVSSGEGAAARLGARPTVIRRVG